MPVERQSEQWPHRREAMLRVAVDWGAPKFLDSAEYPAGTRPQFYHRDEFTDRHHFNPEHYNPPSQRNMSILRTNEPWSEFGQQVRPDVTWRQTEPPQPTLDLGLPSHFSSDPTVSQEDVDALAAQGKGNTRNEVMPVDRTPAKLYRSLSLDLTHPEMAPVRRALFGGPWAGEPPGSPPGLFSESQVPIASPDLHPGLGPLILDHLSNTRNGHDLGIHWSTDEGKARQFNERGHTSLGTARNTWPVLLHADWMGRGEDPYRTDTGGNFPHEREITLMGGAPLRITDVRLQHPDTGRWHSVLDGPQHRQAAFTDDEEDDDEEFDGSYCQSCGKGDGDWCEDCETCAHCDNSHEDHCKSCGPNDADWCAQCDQCTNCDWNHDAHCASCGPNDSDWCEDCQHCNYCDGSCGHDLDAVPVHLNSPLFRAQERPLAGGVDAKGDAMRLFLPHDLNPASEAASRPWVHFEENPDEDPVLLGENLRYKNGVDTIPASTKGAELYRGLTINLKSHPELAPLRRAIYGPEHESYYSGDPSSVPRRRWFEDRRPHQPGMFPGPFSDRELAAGPADPDRLHKYLPALLDHLNSYSTQRGLGEHWSTDLMATDGFSNPHSSYHSRNADLPVRLFGRWMGHGEDPYRPHTGESSAGEFEEEKEISLLPHAPLQLTDLQIFHPKTKQWHSLMDEDAPPIRVHAGRGR